MLNNISNSKKLVIALGVLVVVLLAVYGIKYAYSEAKAKDYSIVYLTSGEIYVGHLHTFPHFKLTGTYILQNVKSAKDNTTNLQLFPLNEAVWAPQELYVNRRQVLFYGPLDPNSVAAKGIQAKGK